ncbi:aminopeptidase [Argonauta hians]
MAASILRNAAKLSEHFQHKRGFILHRSVLKGRLINGRQLSTSSTLNKGLILGVYQSATKDGPLKLSDAAKYFDDKYSGKLSQQIKQFGKSYKKGKCHLLFGVCEDFPLLSVVNLGVEGEGFNQLECRHDGHENVRTAMARGVSQLQQVGEDTVLVDPAGDATAAAEGSCLFCHSYDDLKPEEKRKVRVGLHCFTDHLTDATQTAKVLEEWNKGQIYAESQNFARILMEMPSNLLTPTKFTEIVSHRLPPSCHITIRDQAWAEEQKMGAFLSVSQGSAEPLKFLEISYNNNNSSSSQSSPPVVLVGKGITFDTGGISLKPSNDMDKMRGDMGGAACVAGAVLGMSKLELPVHIKAVIPLCENMPGGRATKPGDVVTARNGKTIQVDNTDAEGRLILADALCYAEETFQPKFILDMATLTGAVDVALGSAATGAYTNSTKLWNLLFEAGSETGDRMWRLPLFQHYSDQVLHSQLAAVNNVGKHSRAGGSCTAAAFLKEFVKSSDWIHLDIAGVMMNKDEVPYLGGGMSGRPTRTVIELLTRLSSLE